jgi:hypothetical protein
MEQIKHMHLIYYQAYVTIVAAGGDDFNAGLPGVSTIRPRYACQAMGIAKGIHVATTHLDPHRELLLSTWNSRGWTLQEKLCSRRALVFTRELMTF